MEAEILMRAIILVLIGCVGCDTSALDRFHPATDGSGGSGGDGGSPDFQISTGSAFVLVRQGGIKTAIVSITRSGGFSQPVPISVNGLPAGVTVDPLTLPDGTSMGTLTFHAAAAAAQGGPTALNINGNAGGISRMASLGVVIAGAPGTLDLSFGNAGKVLIPQTAGASGATGVVLQPDRKIVTSGAFFGCAGLQIALFRFNPDGSLDSTFGAGGRASFGVEMGSAAASVALQPDGKLVVVGKAQPLPQSASSNMVAVRFTSDGSVDTSFGNSGAVTADFGNNTGLAHAVALQRDNRIVLMGEGANAFAIARYLSDGTADASFNGGRVTTSFGATTTDVGKAGAIDASGKIVVIGVSQYTSQKLALARYDAADGGLDPTFGNGGKVLTTFDGDGESVALYPDGKVLVTGGISNGVNDLTNRLLIARFNVNGSLDFSFGASGSVSAMPASFGRQPLLQDDGKIVVAGDTVYDLGATQFAVARFLPDGTPDSSFGTNTGSLSGFVEVEFGGTAGLALAITKEADGRLIVVGLGNEANQMSGIALARIWP
jgi:uncharacterized delta-60 repeat protein